MVDINLYAIEYYIFKTNKLCAFLVDINALSCKHHSSIVNIKLHPRKLHSFVNTVYISKITYNLVVNIKICPYNPLASLVNINSNLITLPASIDIAIIPNWTFKKQYIARGDVYNFTRTFSGLGS